MYIANRDALIRKLANILITDILFKTTDTDTDTDADTDIIQFIIKNNH